MKCVHCGSSGDDLTVYKDRSVHCRGCNGIWRLDNPPAPSLSVEELEQELNGLVSMVKGQTIRQVIEKLEDVEKQMEKKLVGLTGDERIAHTASIATLKWAKGNIEAWLQQQD